LFHATYLKTPHRFQKYHVENIALKLYKLMGDNNNFTKQQSYVCKIKVLTFMYDIFLNFTLFEIFIS